MTVAVSGANTNAIAQIATTWGTAVAGGAGDKLIAEISHSINETELVSRAIGSGNAMISAATRGNEKPTVTVTGDAQFQGAFPVLLSQFMGTAAVSSEVTASQGDFRHTLTFNPTLNSRFVTIAYESSSSTVHEFPTCAVRSFTLRTPSVPGYLEYSAELVADRLQLATSVNTNAVLQAATIVQPEIAAVAFDDDFWIDTEASTALASGDQLDILSYELNLQRPQESANEIKGSTGNGSPIMTDLFQGTLSITLKSLNNHTYYTFFANETPLKCRFTVEGTQIGTGINKTVDCYIPRMQLISGPSYAVASAGVNPITYTFRISAAATNPAGMASRFPYFIIANQLNTGYLA